MSKRPFVSIILVNYNGKRFIGECLDSVLASLYPNFEVVVVDNASTDGSYEYLQSAYSQEQKINLIKTKRQLYFTGGCNLGAKKSRGEKLIFLNTDTVVDKNFIGELVNFASEHKKYLVQPKILMYSRIGLTHRCHSEAESRRIPSGSFAQPVLSTVEALRMTMRDSDQKKIIDNAGGIYNFLGFGFSRGNGKKDAGQYDKNERVDYTSGTCFMIDRRFFEELGGFDEWYRYYYEDIDLNLRAKKQGGQSWYCYKSVIYHKGSLTFKSNVGKEDLVFNIRKNCLRTIIKNFAGWEKLLRVSCLILVYLAFAIQDFFGFRPKRMFLTVKSTIAAFSY